MIKVNLISPYVILYVLPSDDLRAKTNDDPSQSASTYAHDSTHMETGEPQQRFSCQTAVSFEVDYCEGSFDSYEEWDLKHDELSGAVIADDHDSDQCDLLECLEGPKPLGSNQAKIIGEDEEEGVEDYFMAFESEERVTINENTDQQDKGSTCTDVPLYSGAPITVAVSMLLIITFAIRHSLTGLAIADLLTLVSLHCSLPSNCASSMDLVKKFFMRLKNPIQFHYYCTFCMEYQGMSLANDKLCKNKSCLKDLSKKDMSSYFIIIPLICQLRDLIQSK